MTFKWTVMFKGEFYKRIFKGEASTDQSVTVGEMMQAVGEAIWCKHGHAGVTKITATIRRVTESNKKGEKKS